MRTALVALSISLLALAWYNPTMEDFRAFAAEQSQDLILREAGDSALGRALSGAGRELTNTYITRITERRNYAFFSTYTIDMDALAFREPADGNAWRFLGIGGWFMELEQPEVLQKDQAEGS